MIQVKVCSKPGNVSITLNGHANSAPYGQDLVCAGVSTLVQTMILGLETLARENPQYITFEEER